MDKGGQEDCDEWTKLKICSEDPDAMNVRFEKTENCNSHLM